MARQHGVPLQRWSVLGWFAMVGAGWTLLLASLGSPPRGWVAAAAAMLVASQLAYWLDLRARWPAVLVLAAALPMAAQPLQMMEALTTTGLAGLLLPLGIYGTAIAAVVALLTPLPQRARLPLAVARQAPAGVPASASTGTSPPSSSIGHSRISHPA